MPDSGSQAGRRKPLSRMMPSGKSSESSRNVAAFRSAIPAGRSAPPRRPDAAEDSNQERYELGEFVADMIEQRQEASRERGPCRAPRGTLAARFLL